MVEVIERGQPTWNRRHRVKCLGCQSILEFAELEAKRTSDQRDGDFFTIECPVCKRDVHKDAP